MLAAAGIIDLGFAVFHLAFWRLFGWPSSLKPAGGLNLGVAQTLNAVLAFAFAAYGGILLAYAISGQPVAPIALLAGAAFWAFRLVLQFVWFPGRHPASVGISVLFAAAAAVHGFAALPG